MKQIIILLSLFVFLSSCGENIENTKNINYKNEQEEKTLTKKNQKREIMYSNLVDAESQEKIKDILKKYKIPMGDIENFFYYVDYFNDAVGNDGLVEKGFQKLPKGDLYGDKNYLERLEKKNLYFLGMNCRLTSFSLFKNFMDIGVEAKKGVKTTLRMDNASIENFPKKIFSETEKKKFQTFFVGIPTELTKKQEVHIENIQKYWEENNVRFILEKGASVISVWSHDDLDNILFIGHIGLLLENEGEFVFLEKLSFDLPYQAVVFLSKAQLKEYLLSKYGKYKTPQTASPFVMENGQILED